ncbi:MFS general substrate transporter [Backusella circina FSU 941]|nr:MFS general substrate transporter [Backusella circina FSU 941]
MVKSEKSASDIKSLISNTQTHVIEADENAPRRRNKTTPLPKLQMTVICFAIVCEPIVSTIIFPFIYPMVKSFNVSDDEKEIGRYTGWIASSFYIAQFCTIMIWGRVSDLIGRRPVLLIGLLGNSITSCLFGLSKSYWWALGIRALCGIMNSNVGVIRTMLGEISDMTNKGEAFSTYSICWSTGLVLGPALGGYFVFPAKQLPWLFGQNQFLIDHPYFLPCFISSLASFTGFILGYFYLKETNPIITRKRQNQVDERTHLLTRPQSKTLREQFRTSFPKDSIFPIISQCILFFLIIVCDESLPLYVTSPTNVEGLGLSPAKFAIIWTSLGILSVYYRFTILPWGNRRYDTIRLLQFGHSCYIIFLVFFPSLTSIKAWLESHVSDATLCNILFTASYVCILHFRFIASCFSFPSVLIMVNLSASPQTLGFVNGVCQACISLLSIFAPPLAGNLWSWSIQDDKTYPFDYHIVFYTAGLISLMGLLESSLIPKKLAYTKKDC